MVNLVTEGLSGDGLFQISTRELVRRYNSCLKAIGVEPTKLRKFSVDGIGWSPEIAAEKKNNLYMNHGEENQFAIIISPKQYKKPVYFPVYSFIRAMMKKVFDDNLKQIACITGDTGIWLDIDQDLSVYTSPVDLLLFNEINIHVHAANKVIKRANMQQALVARFIQEEDSWLDDELLLKIKQSAETVGDLRSKNFTIPTVTFNRVGSFYTVAFGGVYVIKDAPKSKKPILILEDSSIADTVKDDTCTVFSISNPSLISHLLREGLISIDLKYYFDHHEDLLRKRECMLVDVISDHYPEIDFEALSTGEKKKYIVELKKFLPEEYFEIERLIKKIDNGVYPLCESLSTVVFCSLMYPNTELPHPLRQVLWQLITEIDSLDVLNLYIYNKRRFYSLFAEWAKAKQDWATQLIKNKYTPRMSKEKGVETC